MSSSCMRRGPLPSPGIGAEHRAMGAGCHFIPGDSSQPQRLRQHPETPMPLRLPRASAALCSYCLEIQVFK